MEGGDENGAVPFTGAAADSSRVLPVSEAVDVAVGLELQENQNHSGGDDGHIGVAALNGSGVYAEFSTAKRKRGRPRKHPAEEAGQQLVVVPEFSPSPLKRGRGRPKGSGKWQALAPSLDETTVESTGSNFTPYTVAIQAGENIVQRICSFSQSASESICILSASGVVTTVELLRSGSGGGILRYEGRFEIVSLSGSQSNNGNIGGVDGKICRLSVQLANPNGSLFGGAVAGSLIAGGPTQLVIATFRQKSREQQLPARSFVEPSNPDKGAVDVPLQTANGQLQHGEQVNSVDHRVVNHPDANLASPQPFDWNSLQSYSIMSQHLFSNVNTGNNTDP